MFGAPEKLRDFSAALRRGDAQGALEAARAVDDPTVVLRGDVGAHREQAFLHRRQPVLLMQHRGELALHGGEFLLRGADFVGPSGFDDDAGGIFRVGAERDHIVGDAPHRPHQQVIQRQEDQCRGDARNHQRGEKNDGSQHGLRRPG